MATHTKEQLKRLYEQCKMEYAQQGYSASVETILDVLIHNDWDEYGFIRGDNFETLRQKVLNNGTPLANVGIVKQLFKDYFSENSSRKLVKEHAAKILESGDVQANFECYKLNKNIFKEHLEILNQPKNKEIFTQYVAEKIETMKTVGELEQLDFLVQKLNDVILARKFLAKIKNIDIDSYEKASIWERQATSFVEAGDVNESIWYLLNKPENVPMDAYFDKLEQQVLDSQNGDFNVMFLAKYPNINFKAHEQVILKSNSGIAIRQFAGMYGGREESIKCGKTKNRADLQGCINALSKADSERAIYSFAKHYDQFSDLNLQPLFDRLKKSENINYSEYANQMTYHNSQPQQMQ